MKPGSASVATPPNSAEAWDRQWARDGIAETEERGISAIMDDVKCAYLRPYLPASGTFAEFGCGSARLLRFAANAGLRPIGIDFSSAALELASRQLRRTNETLAGFLRADVRATGLRSNSVDVVASTGLLEHFEDPKPVVGEMVRVLAPGGLFYSDIVPAKFSLFRSLEWARPHHVKIYERSFKRAEIVQLLRDAGLIDIDVFGAGVFPPRLPVLGRLPAVRGLMAKFAELTLPLWRAFDRTRLGEFAGFYYFAVARKLPAFPPTRLSR